jgi:protein involved in ribonucleotide reduction
MSLIVYFSSSSENTHRFVQRLGLPAVRIPLNEREHPGRRTLHSHRSQLWRRRYGWRGAASGDPLLNDVHNRQLIRGVIAAGNRNFGDAWACRGCHRAKMRRAVSLSL